MCIDEIEWIDEIELIEEVEQIKGEHHPPFKGGTGRVSLEGFLGGSPKSYEGVHISNGLPRDV